MSSIKATKCAFCDQTQDYRNIIIGKYMRVFYPKNPSCNYHTLIIPKRHVERFDELSVNEVDELHYLVKAMHTLITKKLGDEYIGYNLLANNGGGAVNQHVMHSHMHMYNRTVHDVNDPVKTHKKDKVYLLTEAEKEYMRTLQGWAAGSEVY